MKSTFVLMILALGLFLTTATTTAQASAAKTIVKVKGARAHALYLALGGDSGPMMAGHFQVDDVSCSRQTETQQGDPDAASEELTFTICSAHAPGEMDSGDYLGVQAVQLDSALRRAGLKTTGDKKNGDVSADIIKCSRNMCVIKQ